MCGAKQSQHVDNPEIIIYNKKGKAKKKIATITQPA